MDTQAIRNAALWPTLQPFYPQTVQISVHRRGNEDGVFALPF
jgi:hypothetical protein